MREELNKRARDGAGGNWTMALKDFKVADLELAPLGRKQIHLAEHEMPGLMAIRAEYADSRPLEG
ncbi:MAG: adenosylhomocysteinase, partial [Microthrixaceae bacterium]|nr:adenosylhomocysteinase [Microthrixaceae bacterium]